MPKTFIKKTGGWTEIRSIFVKKTTGWAEVKNVFLKKLVSGTPTWVKVFTKLSLPDTTTAPSIRTTNTSGVGDQYDGPLAESPRFLDNNLFGKDGEYTNFTSKFGRKFTKANAAAALPSERLTVVTGDLFTSGGGVTATDRTNLDEKYLFFELTVQNGSSANEIQSVSSPVKMIKRAPSAIDFGWTESEEVGTQLAFDYSLENYYYNSIEPGSSYIRWWRSTNTDPGGTLIKQETITATTTGTPSSTSRSGISYYTPTSTDIGFYIVAQIIAVNSNTRHFGFTDNFSLASFPTDGVIGSALTFSNVAVKDYYDKNGLDNRGNWPTGTLNQYTGQLSGYDSNTVLRIRYRVYNYNTGLYWKPSTGTQTTASSAWDSWTSDGSGNGYISNVSVSGGVATFYDYFDLSSDFFNGGGGTPATWWLEVELSAVRGGPRVYYDDHNIIPDTYYISKRIDPTVSVSPSTVGTNANVTISGTFAGFPATPSTNAYPRQYIIYYGDGNNSGYLPSGEWANGTLNPTYSNTWSYSNTGTYTVTVRPVPYGEDATATVTVANLPTNTVLPTLTTDTGNFSAGSTITVNPGTWTNTNSYAYELLYGTSTPISDTSTSTKTLFNTNQYVITNADATASSYYFRGRVTGYANSGQTGASTIALSATSSRSYINSTTTISVGTATSSGFTISGTASPPVYTSISSIQIFNSSQTLISTITTGLPSVNSSTGAWSYIWTGGSSSTTYYAKVTVIASDSAVTTFTTGFSSSIATSAGVSTPTSLTATNNSGAIRLTFSGGSGDQYDVFYENSSSRPTDGQVFADYPNVTSPYDPPLTARDVTRWFWVRKSTGSLRSNWFPSDSSVSIRLPLLAPPTPTITNSAQSSSSLSWHWNQPTPSSSQDEATSWDYAITQNTNNPFSWTNTTTRPTSGAPLVTSSLSASTTYYLHVRAKNKDATGSWTNQSGATTAAVTLYTLSYSANGGSSTPSSQTGANGDTITLAANAGTKSGFTFGGWNIGGVTYSGSGSYTFGSANATATAIWNAVFVEPSTSAPDLQFQRTSTIVRWYCDYPFVSNGTTIGMQYAIRTTAGGGTLLASGTRSYPGDFTYPYFAAGTTWAFRMGTSDGDIAYSASARFGRARVVMQGTNGSTYYGDWSPWI